MKEEHPILFNGAMVRAILEDRKTQTRRLVTPRNSLWDRMLGWLSWTNGAITVESSRVKPGDLLWVRETWRTLQNYDDMKPSALSYGAPFQWKADESANCAIDPVRLGRWRPSILMPRKFCRLELRVKGVRVERIQDISEADAIAEGIQENENGSYDCWLADIQAHCDCEDNPVDVFRQLWDSINKKNPWEKNPYVWVYEFERE